MEIRSDISFLIGKGIQQICYGLFQIQLHFNKEEIRIEIGEGVKYHEKDNNTQEWSYTKGRDFFSINHLLEIPVVHANVDHADNLRLDFENGESLIIKSGKDGNESYIIHHDKDFQVIY